MNTMEVVHARSQVFTLDIINWLMLHFVMDMWNEERMDSCTVSGLWLY